MKNFADDAKGATAIEYALLASIISLVIVAGATSIGGQLKGIFTQVSTSLK